MVKETFLRKYAPKKREEVVGNKELIERIFSNANEGIIQNMILTGEYGLGKTTIAEMIARYILGENFAMCCIRFNASSATGVDNIRENVIATIKLRPQGLFWLFIFDECEKLSPASQDALKKAMEPPYDKTSRFMFICNDYSKISGAIKDRCRTYVFRNIKTEEMMPRLKYIRDQEKIKISDDLLMKIAESSNGSMRHPLMLLEELKSLKREIVESDITMEKSIEAIKSIFSLLKSKKVYEARDIVFDFYDDGCSFDDIIRFFHNYTLESLQTNGNFEIKTNALIKIAESERNVKEGCNQFIQLTFLLSNISLLLQKTAK